MPKLSETVRKVAVENWLKSIPDISSDNDISRELLDLAIIDPDTAIDKGRSIGGMTHVHNANMNAITYKKVNSFLNCQFEKHVQASDEVQFIHLRGSKCNLHVTESNPAASRKHKYTLDNIQKRVTFKAGADPVVFDDNEFFNEKVNRHAVKIEEKRNTGRIVGNEPKGQQKKREKIANVYVVCTETETKAVNDDKTEGTDASVDISREQRADTADTERTKAELDDVILDAQSKTTVSSGGSKSQKMSTVISRLDALHSRWTRSTIDGLGIKTLHLSAALHRANVRSSRNPVIMGLVVDSASNRKPSIVRASRNANTREEFALKQRIDGYRIACSDNINTIKYAQRRMCSNLVHLKNKIATASAARAEADDKRKNNEFEGSNPISTEMVLPNKGYTYSTEHQQQQQHPALSYCFPPLTYPKRRLLSVT